MSMSTAQVATGAIWAAWSIFGAIVLAVAGALWNALASDGLGWVTITPFQAVCVALSLVCLVPVWRVLGRVLVTYVHTYPGERATNRPEADGRHARGYGRRTQGPGRHRATA